MNATRVRAGAWMNRNGWPALMTGLLAIICAMLVFLITSTDKRLNDHDTKIDDLAIDVNDLKNISKNLVETYNGKRDVDDRQNEEILELWKCTKRSGSTQSGNVLMK